MRAHRARGDVGAGDDVGVGLLRRFAVGALVVFLAVGAALYLLVYRDALAATEERARNYASIASAAVSGSGVVKPEYLRSGFPRENLTGLLQLAAAFDVRSGAWETASIYSTSGVVIVASDTSRIGAKVGVGKGTVAAFGGDQHQEVVDGADLLPEVRPGRKLVTHVPFRLDGRVVGALELVQSRPEQEASAQAAALSKALVLAAGLLTIYLLLLSIVSRAARVQEAQRRRAADLLERERQTVRRLEELDAAKDELLAFSAHEFRTPLTSLLGFAQTLAARRRELPDDVVDDYLATIVRQARRLERVSDDFLDVAAIEARRLDVATEDVGAADVARGVVAEFAGERVALHVDGEPTVLADPGRLEQVLTNLVRNALVHGPQGGKVELRVCADDVACHFDVVDEGDGLAPELADRAFGKFERGERRASGSGLGLYIASHLAGAMGGTLSLLPNAPSTTFRVTVPLAAELPGLEPEAHEGGSTVRAGG